MNETALEWFLKNLPERFKNAIHNTCQEEIEKAREMEKTQTENAFDMGRDETTRKFIEDGEEYYNNKYNNSIKERIEDIDKKIKSLEEERFNSLINQNK